ncbi:MAG: hypothetical protein JWO05_603 [Gemmatimonadetes bacterium]|nr:hypothetical protein [Gemmatimonadota bacterium]
MATQPARSLKHEYELFVEEEIENYKESIPRSAILAIGDEAVRTLSAEPQLALTEMLLWEEVDRVIVRRLRLPAYTTWRKRRLKILAELRRPEHWGLHPDDPVVRALRPAAEGHVLVAGVPRDAQTLYLAANGCEVTAIGPESEALERVLIAAEEAGLTDRVHALDADFSSWIPDGPLHAVICTPEAFIGLSAAERARVIAALQSATADGGVHLLQAIAVGKKTLSLTELHRWYEGWEVTVEQGDGLKANTFLARKELS